MLLSDLLEKYKIKRREADLLREQQEREICAEYAKRREKLFEAIYEDVITKRAYDLISRGLFGNELETVAPPPSLVSEIVDEEESIHSFVPPEVVAKAKEFALASEYEEADRQEANNQTDSILPEPIFEDNSLTLEQVENMILNFIDTHFTQELSMCQEIPPLLEQDLIPVIQVSGTLKQTKIMKELKLKLDPLYFRTESFFETISEITMDEAHELLCAGYFFLSKFGYTCPVDVYENRNPIQLFLAADRSGDVFPIIHRQYIYYVRGKENVGKFKSDPLKYGILQERESFPLIGLRVAIIGGPKTGCSNLAKRFESYFGLRLVSRGSAIRYVLTKLNGTRLACQIEEALRKGKVLSHKLVMKAVELFSLEENGVGIVFDGFPTCKEEIHRLFKVGLVPHTIIHLESTFENCAQKLRIENKGLGRIPTYSIPFIKHRYCKWHLLEPEWIDWLNKHHQNVITISCEHSKWYNWITIRNLVIPKFATLINYLLDFNKGVYNLANFSISEAEFKQRWSSTYLNYCPCCLLDGKLSRGALPVPDRAKLYQYNEFYYFICDDHKLEFTCNPNIFLYPINEAKLPELLPKEVEDSEFPIYEKGFCLVCFWNKKGVLNQGLKTLSVEYNKKLYLFDTKECLTKFMEFPELYANRVINFKETFRLPPLNLKALPIMGYIQQTQGRLLTQACTRIGRWRPKFPTLSPTLSACISLGLYLKLHNPKIQDPELQYYKNYQQKFEEGCKNLKLWITQSKQILNPYLHVKPSEDTPTESTATPSMTETSESESFEPTSMFEMLGEDKTMQFFDPRDLLLWNKLGQEMGEDLSVRMELESDLGLIEEGLVEEEVIRSRIPTRLGSINTEFLGRSRFGSRFATPVASENTGNVGLDINEPVRGSIIEPGTSETAGAVGSGMTEPLVNFHTRTVSIQYGTPTPSVELDATPVVMK